MLLTYKKKSDIKTKKTVTVQKSKLVFVVLNILSDAVLQQAQVHMKS
jgi:hypothetical protein